MPRLSSLQTNFASGELDPLMHFRVDTGAYSNGARRLRNALLFSSGGAARRPGTNFCHQMIGNSRLIPFDFASDERYVLAFSNGRLDVYNDSGVHLTQVTAACNWTTASLFEFTYAHRGDTMIICHPTWEPQVIKRTGASSFTVTDFLFTESVNGDLLYQPYYKFAPENTMIKLSAISGTGVTLTASSGYFTIDYVGTRLRWKNTEMYISGFTNSTTLTVQIEGTLIGNYDNNPLRTSSGSTTVVVTHVKHGIPNAASIIFAGAGDTGGITAANLNGTRTITVIDDNSYSFTAGAAATESIDGGGPSMTFSGANVWTRDWYEQAFSDVNGYPGAVAFHEGRLWMGGSPGIPDGLFSSKLFEYFNFDVGDGSTADSIQITLGAEDLSNVRHIVANDDLQIFTATAELRCFAPRDGGLSPATVQVRQQTPYGAGRASPKLFDGATLYLQASGTALREYIFNEATQRYLSTNLNVLSGHLLSNPYSMAVLYGGSDRSEQYAYVVNDDGSVAVFYSARSEELAGWTYWDQGGEGSPEFKDFCTLGEDVFCVSYRHGNYYLEKFSPTRDMTIDGATTYTNGTATASWTLGSQYFGRTVSVVSGNYYIGDYTADGSGNITIDAEVTEITVGYNYTFSIKTLPVELQLQVGSTIGLAKRIVRCFVGLDSALSLSISGTQLVLRQAADSVESAPSPVTGTYEFRLLGYQKDAFIEITQAHPLPVTVLGLNMEVQI